MLYIINVIVMTIWLAWIIKKGKYTWGTILTAFFIMVLIADLAEVSFIFLLDFYKFHTHLLADFSKDNQLGVILSDVVILPMTMIIVCHYFVQSKKRWQLILLFTIMQGLTEVLYVRLGYLVYYHWSTWISVLLYFVGLCIFAKYAPRFLRKEKPVPYPLTLTASVYSIGGMFGGAIFGGELLNYFQWRPYIFNSPHADDRFSEIGSLTLLAILTGFAVSKIKVKYRPVAFVILSIVGILYYSFAHSQGWLIYHKWNFLLTIIRWVIPFLVIAWLDHKESFRT